MMLTNDHDDQDDQDNNAMVIKMIAFDHDDHHHTDQTQVPMWPVGDFYVDDGDDQ